VPLAYYLEMPAPTVLMESLWSPKRSREGGSVPRVATCTVVEEP
jgi:hypothetical protein